MKRFFGILLTVVMMLSTFIMVVPPIEAEAATEYNFLFPVNNGGVKIAFYYGSTPEYANGAFHYGIDIYANTDQVIYAAFSGTVTVVSNSCSHVHYPAEHGGAKCDHYSSWGNAVHIKSDDGKIVGIYGHLKQDSILVKNGDKIEKGQPLASMGSSGGSYNKHLHFEVRKSGTSTTINVNPTNSSKNPGVVNYSTDGYKQISSDVISEGTYIFNNGGYKMYMKKDASNFGTLGASNDTTTSKFEFNVIKDGNFYRVVPKDGGANYLNSVWTDTQDTHSLSGAEVTLCKNDKNDYSQKWIFEKYGDGYIIHPACTPAFAITRDGSKLIVEKTVYSDAQIWKLEGEECDHNYISFEWDDVYHWQECTKCGDKKNYEAHKWTVVTAAIGIDFHTLICEVCNDVKTPKHEYDNNCDASCNVCGAIRSVSHVYSNDCDINCNVCGLTRQITHKYDNNCDASCNVCGATRQVTHKYSSDNDAICNECGYKREIACDHNWITVLTSEEYHILMCVECTISRQEEHTYYNDIWGIMCSVCGYKLTCNHWYSSSCDASCNSCGEIRTISHTYTNDCDAICNVCEATRETSHIYSNGCDDKCNVCDTVRPIYHIYSNDSDITCNVCGATRDIAHTHSYGDYEYDFYGHWRVCLTCGESEAGREDHVITSVYIVDETYHGGNCSICGGGIALKHTYTDECDKYCNDCNIQRQPDHVYTNADDEYCDICGEPREEICIVHNFSSWIINTDPTCTIFGVQSRYCENCNYIETIGISKLDHSDINNDGECDMCGESYGDNINSGNNTDDNQGTDKDNYNGIDSNSGTGCGGVIGGSLWFVVVILVGTVAVATDKKRKY